MSIKYTIIPYDQLPEESLPEWYKDFIKKNKLNEAYPSTWDKEAFKKMKTFKERVRYCDEKLKKISSGSSRIVYLIDDEKVLKLAKNRKGIAQNKIEIEYGHYYDLQNTVAKIFDSDDTNLWVEMELAKKVTPKIFQEVVGFTFNDFCRGLKYAEAYNMTKGRLFGHNEPENYQKMWDNYFIGSIFEFVIYYDIPIGDLCKLSTYGLVTRNNKPDIVLIDYGLTNEVYDSYYK